MESYLVVRSHGLKLHLLKPSDYDELLKSKDPIQTLAVLGYDNVIDVYGRSWPEVLQAVYAKLVERVEPLIIDESYRKFFTAFLDRLEVANCKIKLRALIGEKTWPILYYPYNHHLDLETLSRAGNIREYYELLSKTPYGLKLGYALNVYEKTGISNILEFSIDFSYYNYYFGIAKEVEFEKFVKMEKEIYKAYWGELFDKLGEIPEATIPETFKVEPKGLSSQISAMRDFLTKLKVIAREEHLGRGYVYAYLISCWVEAINVEKILLGKKLNIENNIIIDSLLPLPL
jgi:vacuolar-type H+-ATPase subunit C/Vma6